MGLSQTDLFDFSHSLKQGKGIDHFLLALSFIGIGLIDGYDSHSSSGEVVIFSTQQILPLGMLHMDVVPSREVE
jgi:hypothetical protein